MIIPYPDRSFEIAIKVLPLQSLTERKTNIQETPSRANPFVFIRSSVKLLLVCLHVHVTLQLGARRSELEAELTAGRALVQLVEALHAAVLHRVLEARGQVGNELGDRTATKVSKQESGSGREQVHTPCERLSRTHPGQQERCHPQRSIGQYRRCSSGCPCLRCQPSCPAWHRCCPCHGTP